MSYILLQNVNLKCNIKEFHISQRHSSYCTALKDITRHAPLSTLITTQQWRKRINALKFSEVMISTRNRVKGKKP